ncbi:hypothetical protein FHS85_003806 [Rhodoligotrophos appendicifer]|uniref:hypothetical protein n=1 Tax=Rhodoligotrophos appendicifer TaxID=987056 RepID=UPI0011851911|nr:hypothetical protein [Rhodoligotrophos appendicifer]
MLMPLKENFGKTTQVRSTSSSAPPLAFDAELGQPQRLDSRIADWLRNLMSRQRLGEGLSIVILWTLKWFQPDLMSAALAPHTVLQIGWRGVLLAAAPGETLPVSFAALRRSGELDRPGPVSAELLLAVILGLQLPKLYRIELRFGVEAQADLNLGLGVLLNMALQDLRVQEMPPPMVFTWLRPDGRVVLALRFCTQVQDYRAVAMALKSEAHAQLAAVGIEVPYPERSLHVVRELTYENFTLG